MKKNLPNLRLPSLWILVAKVEFSFTLQLNFLTKPGEPHVNEMLFMEIGLSTYI